MAKRNQPSALRLDLFSLIAGVLLGLSSLYDSPLMFFVALVFVGQTVTDVVLDTIRRAAVSSLLFQGIALCWTISLAREHDVGTLFWLICWIWQCAPMVLGLAIASLGVRFGLSRVISIMVGFGVWDVAVDFAFLSTSPVYLGLLHSFLAWPAMAFGRSGAFMVWGAVISGSWRVGVGLFLGLVLPQQSIIGNQVAYLYEPASNIPPSEGAKPPSLPTVEAGAMWVFPEESWPVKMGGSVDDFRAVELGRRVGNGIVGVRAGDENRALHIENGTVASLSAKQHLIPLLEDEYSAGEPTVASLLGARFQVAICYDDSFATTAFESNGTNAIVLLTSGFWAPEHLERQRQAAAQVLAISSGRYLLRASASGGSTLITPTGAVSWRANEGISIHRVEIPLTAADQGVSWSPFWLLGFCVALGSMQSAASNSESVR